MFGLKSTPGSQLRRRRDALELNPGAPVNQSGGRERGATMVIFALLIPVLFGSVAMAVDYGRLLQERQHLSNALDAAALAGAYSLPNDPAAARVAALNYARANDPEADPAVSFWCVLASTGAGRTVLSAQIPSVCDAGTVAGARCNEQICAIPCIPGAGRSCNTITVTDDKNVPFAFAPVIGISTGNTGSLSADACRGSCGASTPNPMDIALVADRTGSMSTADRNLMVSGIKTTLLTMTKEQQYVALGTIHRSKASPGSCITAPSTDNTGPWIPVPFSNDYALSPATAGATPPLNSGSTLVKGLNCLAASSQGTYLASPLKAAARYVLGLAPNNLAALPVRSTPARKGIIFETDGQPNEGNLTAGTTSLNTAGDIGSTNGATACNNLKQVAVNTKSQGVLIVTVAFGDATSARCASGGELVRNVLAASASPDSQGNPSDADNDCSTTALRAVENSDGDFFFCAANGTELGPIFVSAINAINPNSRLIRIPG
ncbi:TadE/TadG family type IV pilus assembly protein [Arthrobacter sp. H16F315]|uniref:TadE/TadG family type IV pilus assembly protein n=1 Tax=Arthrobacter sp. H16F315 TaxID=2955314 RepID=UPI002097F50B|nr:pilus assembly protein TadG-related protein [Arthrobacter sp. H16F315]MDD1476828.1 pilus assembly protein TadG-related protein [Arthrobacter sp. H16F315]